MDDVFKEEYPFYKFMKDMLEHYRRNDKNDNV